MSSVNERVFRVWHREESRYRPDQAALRARFGCLLERMGAQTPTADAFVRLHAAWSSEARRYHDLEHLTDCLRELDGEMPSPARDRVELALWYHDAIYEAGASDCEERSAAWLTTDAAALGVPSNLARAAAALVQSTAHGRRGTVSDEEALVADIDLAILGRDPLRFMDFEYGVEEEFAAVPNVAFRRGRGRFLASLLAAPIYRTPLFRDRFELAARANVGALLASRRYGIYRWLRWLP